MNDIPTEPGIEPNPLKDPKSVNIWDSMVAMLRSVIVSIFHRSYKNRESAELSQIGLKDSVTPTPEHADGHIESLVDVSKLPDMAFKRDVLDWRDNFHANLIVILSSLHDSFDQKVEVELADTSLFRKLVSRKSDKVLQDGFIRIVRLPLITAIRKEEAKLNACAQKWGVYGKTNLEFHTKPLSHECKSLHDIAFKPTNKDKILSVSKDMIFGPAGLAAAFHDQGLQLSKKLMDVKAS